MAGGTAVLLAATLLVSIMFMLPARAYPGALLPGEGAYFGSRVQAREGENGREALQRVESQIGRLFDIDHQYYSWRSNIPTSHQRWDVNTGRIPFINWKSGTSWSEIANGSRDAWIRDRADAFIEFGEPIYLAYHHEPENDLSGYGSPQDYAAAFRHIVEVFRDRGVTNVGFVWNMMARNFNPSSGLDMNTFYPGDAYVDFIGGNGYNWYPGKPGSNWASFETIFADINAWSIAHSKPWMVVEYGVQEDPDQPGRKAQWFRDALATAKTWPSLKALIYFDTPKEYDWITDSSESSLQGYAELANDPWFRQQPGSGLPPTPAPTPTPSPSPPPPPSGGAPPVVKNGLNVGPQGADIEARARRGGATPFDGVSTTKGATLTYDRSHARGAFSAKHVLNARSDSFYQWGGVRSVWYGRIFVWLDAYPAGDLRLVRALENGSLRCSINIRSSGQIGFQDRENLWVAESQTPIATRRWVRIEWKVDQRRGRVKLKIFAHAKSLKPSAVVRMGPRLDIGSSADLFQFGRSGSNDFSITFWTDAPALSTRAFLGPGSGG